MRALEEGPFPYLALPIDFGDVTTAVSELPSAHPIVAVEAGLEIEMHFVEAYSALVAAVGG